MFDEETIVKATVRCFQAPDPQAVVCLEELLALEPEELMRQCVVILQTANAVLEEENRQLASIFLQQGRPIVCGPGCTGCCHQLVLCQPFEATVIRGYLETHPEKMQVFRAAYPHWDKATATLRTSYVAWAENRYGRGEDDGSHSVEDYQTPCPLLDAEGRCAIYPVRPYGCRTCIALDPDCATPAKGQSGTLHMQFTLYTSHHEARMAVTRMLLRRLNVETTPVPMPEMLASLCLQVTPC